MRKIFRILETLSPKEKKNLESWIVLKDIKNSKQLHQLFLFLLHRPNVKEDHQIWAAISDKPYKASELDKLCSQLSKIIEEYLAVNQFLQSRDQINLQLIKALSSRDQAKLVDETYHETLSELEKGTERDADYYLKRYELEANYQHFFLKNQDKIRKPMREVQLNEYTDLAFFHRKLLLAIMNINNLATDKEKLADPFLESVLNAVESKISDSKHVGLYFLKNLYELVKANGPTERSYLNENNILSEFEKHLHLFTPSNQVNLYNSIYNCFIYIYRSAKSKQNLYQLLSAAEFGIKKELVFHDGHLPWNHYRNIVLIALLLNDIPKSEDYLEEYKLFLPKKIREDAYTFGRAYIYFHKQNWIEAKKEFNALILKNKYFEINRRYYLRKIDFLTGQTKRTIS